MPGKLVVLDVGGRDEPLAEELLASLDYVSPNEASRIIILLS